MARLKLNALGQDIFEGRYAYPGETTYADRCKVMAKLVAAAEPAGDVEKVEKKFYDALADGDFVPGGRILYGAGRTDANLLN